MDPSNDALNYAGWADCTLEMCKWFSSEVGLTDPALSMYTKAEVREVGDHVVFGVT